MTLKEAMAIVQQLATQERYVEAKLLLDRLDVAAPRQPSVAYSMGVIAEAEGRLADALRHFERAAEIEPELPIFHWSLALILLGSGDLRRGWKEFEWRTKVQGWTLGRGFEQPQWTGQDIAGRTLLLHAEGGHGDAIQFCRYVPSVTARGATVLLECHRGLVPLLARLPGVDAIFARGEPLPAFDFHCPLQSLAIAFDTTLETIPNQVPYLQAPAELVELWWARLGARTEVRRVGICWAGSHTSDNRRSRTLSIFGPLAQVPGVEFHSLQTGEEALEPRPHGLNVIDHVRELTDFAQTAALVQSLDLVISVDTSIAHLAGALARETWVLIPKIPDFRWLRDRSDSPWYPTMRLFRQERSTKDWSAVTRAIADALRQWSTSRSQGNPPDKHA